MKTTTNTKINDINRLRKNTESFLLGFLKFTTSQKPPFANSWLGFDFDRNNYVFMCLKGYSSYETGGTMIYYPDNMNRILITSETTWMQKLYANVNYHNANSDGEYLRRIASTLQPILMQLLDRELGYLKSTLPVENKPRIGKLF